MNTLIKPNQYLIALWLTEELTYKVVNLVNILSELSFTDKVSVGLNMIDLNQLEDNFIIQEKANLKTDLTELVINFLTSLVNYSRLIGADTPDFPTRVFLINDYINLENVIELDSEIENIEQKLVQIVFPYAPPRFVFWNINADSELINLKTCSFVGSTSEFTNKDNKLVQRIIYEECCDLEKFTFTLDNFNLVLPRT